MTALAFVEKHGYKVSVDIKDHSTCNFWTE